MPTKPTTPRKNRPGQGRKPVLKDPVRLEVQVERETRQRLGLLADRPHQVAEHVRAALAAYLAREDIAARIQERRELLAEGDL